MKKDELWPPKWPVWAYHDFQYDTTFNVAKVDMSDSLQEFIKNSQDYQSRLLKYAIENYRKNKYSKITGIFQFMFVDNWNAITWSVVDYFRRPKKSYHVLKIIYQPVLIGMDMDGEKISLDTLRTMGISSIWIVSDTLEKYENTYAEINLLKDKEIAIESKIEIGCIPADCVKHFFNPPLSEGLIRLNLKEKGIYHIEMKLKNKKGNIISRNSYMMEVV